MPKTVTGQWQFPDGSPANGATLYLKLSQDAVAIGTSQIAPRVISIVLNSSGQIPALTSIYANDELTPFGTVYIASVIAPGGGLVYGPDLLSIAGASPINLNSLIPTNVGGIVISYPNPVLQNPSAPQVINGQPLTINSTVTASFFVSTNFISGTANPAATGVLRLASTDSVAWRNNANNLDLLLNKDTSDNLRADAFATLVGNKIQAQSNFQSSTTNIAASGMFRLASADTVNWRNNANNADIVLGKNASDQLTFAGTLVTQTIASGTAVMTTAAIGSLAVGTTVTVAAAGVLTTDTIIFCFNAAPAANPGELVINAWPTSGNVNFQYANPTAGSVTPNAATLNWRVVR